MNSILRNYQIKLKYKLFNNSLADVCFPLEKAYDVQDILQQQPTVDCYLEELSIELGQFLYKLNDKKDQIQNNQQINNNITVFLEYITSLGNRNQLKAIELINQNSSLSVNDEIFAWLEKCDLKWLQKLQFACISLSDEQFQQFSEIVSERLESLEELIMHFSYYGSMKKKINGKIRQNKVHTLKILKLQSHEQLDILSYFPNLDNLQIGFYCIQDLSVEKVIGQITLRSPQIKKLRLLLSRLNSFKKGCIKELEKLQNLTYLFLHLAQPLSKQELDLNRLQKLEELTILCFNPKEYLQQINKKNMIKRLAAEQIGKRVERVEKFNFDNLIHIDHLEWVFYCSAKSHLEGIKRELKGIGSIAHKLKCLKLDFSECKYLQQHEMENQLIELIGETFSKCTDQTKINLITRNCMFSQQRRLDLALQFQKIPLIDMFEINDENISAELAARYIWEKNKIDLEGIHEKILPYYYGVLSQCIQYYNAIIPINYKRLFPFSLEINNCYRQLFTNFRRFVIFNGYYFGEEQLSQLYMMQRTLPEDTVQIKFRQSVNIHDIVQIKDNYEFLKILQCTMVRPNMNDLSFPPLANVKKNSTQLEIHLSLLYLDFDQLLNIFLFENDFINIQLYVRQIRNIQEIKKLFDKINEEKLRVLVKIQEIMYGTFAEAIESFNEYCAQIEKTKNNILAFQKQIEFYLPINPQMVYSDLYID